MAELLPLQPGPGQVVKGPRPHTALSAPALSSTRRQTGGRFGQTWIQAGRVHPVTYHPGQGLNLKQLFPDGTGLARKGGFRRVLESRLPVCRNELNRTAFDKVCDSRGETVDHGQFLGSFRRAPTTRGASVRRGPRSASTSLPEMQKRLQEKIGGDLRSMFDCDRGGRVRWQEFRRVMDDYCLRLTDEEFQRLWKHYSPNNTSNISYELFLDKLGFGDGHDFETGPVCTKLEVLGRGATPPEQAQQRKRRPESLSASCGAPSVFPHRKLQTLFRDKVCMNSAPVWQALQAFDATRSGLVTPDVLRAVLSSFVFPMSPRSFQKLISCYGVRATGPVRWKHFLGHFMCPDKGGGDPNLQSDGASEQPAPVEDTLQHVSPQLKERFHLLDKADPQRTGHVVREDLKRVLSCYGVPITDTHFNKPCTSPQPPPGPQVGPGTCGIPDITLQKVSSRSGQRPTDHVQATAEPPDRTLSETDIQKILQDSGVTLSDKNFNKLTEPPGFGDGRTECSAFLAEYQEASARDEQQGSEGRVDHPLLATAEQCLAAMKTRIKFIHRDNWTAFRLMDRKRRGVVDRRDFRGLHDSLGFFCGEEEYQRLLDLVGLHPGGNLNYAEFVAVVESAGKRTRATSTQEQLHELLACDARYKWADMSKALCQFEMDGRCWIRKKSLRELLFTYALPLTSDEFEQLWLRYDPEGQGRVVVCDFLEKLGFHHKGELRPRGQKTSRTAAQQNADRPASCVAAPLESTELKVSVDDDCKMLVCADLLSASDHETEKCERPPASPDTVAHIESLESLSPDVALARMRVLVAASAPNLYKAFMAFDQSRTGMVKALDFRQVLENFCAHLSDKQYCYILTKLELDCENCTVSWVDFLNKFQSQNPLMSAQRCLSRTREQAKTRSPNQTKTPTDLNTTIPKERFRQRMGLTNDQFECVRSQTPVDEQRELWYGELPKCFGAPGGTEARGLTNDTLSASPEPGQMASATASRCPKTAGAILQRTKSAPQGSSRHPASAGRPGTGSPPGGTEGRLRRAVRRRWKEIRRSCSEEDPQQEGHIGAESFLGILQSFSIDVTREQFERLPARFGITDDGRVSYHDFLRHLLLNSNAAEADETAFERRKLPLPVTAASRAALSRDCAEVMLRMYDVVRSSWAPVRRRFLASDRGRTGLVSAQDFRKVLRHFDVSLSEEEFFHLSSCFDARATGKICYHNFLWAFLR